VRHLTINPLIWIGLAGIEDDDNERARLWQHRLHRLMIAVALLALPAYLMDSATSHPALHQVASALDVLIFVAFLFETLWMLHVTSFPVRYLLENWLNVVILAGAAASALGAATEWVVLIRVARVAVGSLVLVRALAEFKVLFTRRGAPLLVGATCLVLLGGGGMLYWLEPSITSYWDGLWLAFVTGTTIGYGDFVPTSPAARVFAVFIAIVGVALMTLFTANLVAIFLGRDDGTSAEQALVPLRQDVERHLLESRDRWNALETELRALHAEIAALRDDLGVRASPGRKPPASPEGPTA
jgi:voltage-gated potassium channel